MDPTPPSSDYYDGDRLVQGVNRLNLQPHAGRRGPMSGMRGRQSNLVSTMENDASPTERVYDPYSIATGAPVHGEDGAGFHSYQTRNAHENIPRRPTSEGAESHASSTRRTSSTASSSTTYYPTYSLYPAPTKPLPALPPKASSSARTVTRASSTSERSVGSSHRSSQYSERSSATGSGTLSATSNSSQQHRQAATSPVSSPPPPSNNRQQHNVRPQTQKSSQVHLRFNRMLVSEEKRSNNCIYFLDVSSSSSTLASKHGNNIVKVWSLDSGEVQSAIKFTSYTDAQSRSREYLIKSHAILSETSKLIAIAAKFGRAIEIWNWEKKKCLQTIDGADRWAVGKMEAYDHGWGRFAAYHGESGIIELFAATREKKPYAKMRTIKLAEANLPFVPQYPELALSATSPLLVAAAGPRPPRHGHPPPERETLLVAWETHDNGVVGSKPYRVARPWQHKELDTAIPSDLATYGSVVVSIWIPATFRAVPVPPSRGTGFNLTTVKVPSRFVLVWDLAANSTRTFAIPNCTSCISPDCRYIAYCHNSGAAIGARGCISVIDVMSGQEVWCWPDRNASAIDSGPQAGFKQFDDLASVTELAFSADGKSLVVAGNQGRTCVYDILDKEPADD